MCNGLWEEKPRTLNIQNPSGRASSKIILCLIISLLFTVELMSELRRRSTVFQKRKISYVSHTHPDVAVAQPTILFAITTRRFRSVMQILQPRRISLFRSSDIGFTEKIW